MLYHNAPGSVGYTIVGSPTIVDGVASGFTTSNYLKTPEFSPGSNPWEIVTSFTLGTLTTGNGILTGLGTTNSVAPLVIPYTAPQTIFSYLSSNGTSWNIANGVTILSNLQANTKYVIKMEFTGTAYNWYLKQNNSWELIKTIVSSTPIYGNVPLLYGNNRATNYPFNGSIDLNETYITVNGQPWFGLCPIEVKKVSLNNNTVKYIIKDGKLIWADPNLYLVNSGRAYINTGVPSNAVTNYKIDYRITDNSIRIFATGADVSFRNKSDTFIGIANSGLYWYYGTGDSAFHVLLSKSSEYYLQKNRLEVNYSSTSATGSIYNNTEQISSYTTTASELSNNNYYLFGINRNGTATLDGSLRIYSAQYYGSNINKHLVPVPQGLRIGSFTVPSNGMFDIVNQQFYGNQGAGEFTIERDE